MYAIIANGGKQYKVQEGDVILLDCLNLEPKSKVEVSEVLAICDGGDIKLGAPYVRNAEKESFREQYKQPVANLAGGISVVKFQAPNEGEIQAMTGATITSTAVTNAVNSAIEMYQAAYASEGGN